MHVHDPCPAMTNQSRQGLSGDAWTYTIVFNDKRQFLLVTNCHLHPAGLGMFADIVQRLGQNVVVSPLHQVRRLLCSVYMQAHINDNLLMVLAKFER